jgi:DNA segregation ATPase FtsK/SpoIIIE-like protein
MDELEAAGIVGSFDGSKGREVLLDNETDLEALL